MDIHLIKLYNFKSFEGWHDLEFVNKGIFKIEGPVGAGKTTIGEALVFALYGSITGKNNGDLITWGKKQSWVYLNLTHNGRDIYIKREIKSYGQSELIVEVDNIPLTASNKKGIQAQLEEMIGVPKIFVELLCIVSLANFRSLSSMSKSDLRDFSNNILGLDIIETYLEVWKGELTKLNKDIAYEEGRQSVIHEGLLPVDKPDIKLYEKKASVESRVKHAADLQRTRVKHLHGIIKELETTIREHQKHNELIARGICPTCGGEVCGEKVDPSVLERRLANYNRALQHLNVRYQQVFTDLDKEYSEVCNEITRQEISYNNYLDAKKKQHTDLKKSNKCLEVMVDRRNKLQELVEIFRGVVTDKLIGEFVPSINSNIQYISSLIHSQFIPEFDNKFRCTLNGDVPISSLSTGQRKMVDIAIILGVLMSLVVRVDMNILFLDELFSNLDKDNRDRFVKVLKDIMSDKTVFIVSHQDIDCDGILRVTNKNGSRISYI